jgi:hypothetical protein
VVTGFFCILVGDLGGHLNINARRNRAEKEKRKMTIYTEFTIRPADSGFGMWQRGEKAIGPETSYADLNDLIMDGELIDLETALEDQDFLDAGIEDIRGRIYNEPGMIYCAIGEQGDGSPCVRYFGVEEDEVGEDFFE